MIQLEYRIRVFLVHLRAKFETPREGMLLDTPNPPPKKFATEQTTKMRSGKRHSAISPARSASDLAELT